MSAESTRVTDKHFSYVAAHTQGEDAFLQNLKREAAAAGIPPIWISPEQASMMQILLKLINAKEVVEVGTLGGYSAIWMARALPDGGHVRTIEISEKHKKFAEAQAAKSDVAGKVQVLHGAGADVLPKLKDNSADAAFLDADKKGYPVYLRQCLRIVRPGGLVMVDNAFAFGELFEGSPRDPEVGAVREFNEIMARETRLHAVIVPIGDGLWVGVKK